MSAPICPTHGEGFGSPCYLCVDAENRTLRERYAEAVRALRNLAVSGDDASPEMLASMAVAIAFHPFPPDAGARDAALSAVAVLSRPEAQEVLRG